MTYVQLGKITIPAVWLAVVVAFVLLAFVYRIVKKKGIEEWYWNSFFLYILVWKLSYIVFHFSFFLDMPLSILYFNGGTKGHILGVVAVMIYVLFIARRKYAMVQREFFVLFICFFLSYEILLNMMYQHYMESLVHLLLFLVYLYYVNGLRKNLLPFSIQVFLILLLSELFVMTMFGSIFSVESMTFLWLAVTAFVFLKKER